MLYSLFASFQQNEHGVCQNYYECVDFDIYCVLFCFILFWCSPVTWAHERLLGFAPKSFDMTLMVFRSFLAFWSDKMLLARLLWPVSFSVVDSAIPPGVLSSLLGEWYFETIGGVRGVHYRCCVISCRHFQLLSLDNWFFVCLREKYIVSLY